MDSNDPSLCRLAKLLGQRGHSLEIGVRSRQVSELDRGLEADLVAFDGALEISRLKSDLNELFRELGLLVREVGGVAAGDVAEKGVGERRRLADPPGHLQRLSAQRSSPFG